MVRSVMRFSWAMSLFGVRQAQEIFEALGTARVPRRVGASFDAISDVAEQHLGAGLQEAYHTGDRWQRRIVDAVFGAVDPAVDLSRRLTSRTLVRGSLAVLRQSAGMLEAAMPTGRRAPFRELRNKLEAFDGFQYADQILGFRNLSDAELKEQIADAGCDGPYLSLWLTEGLGFAFSEATWDEGEPRDLLRRSTLDQLPEESLIPLHTGMGLSLARHVLPEIAAGGAALEAGVRHFTQLCDRNARDGFLLASFEALGLIVRQLAPESTSEVAAALQVDGQENDFLGAFWHGYGRGLYFVVTQTLPGSTGRAVEKIRQETPSEFASRNALAGLVWALTLVNFRQPEILEEFLNDQQFEDADGAAVSQGIAAAVVLWHAAAGEDALFAAFRDYQAVEGTELWQRRVTVPCAETLASWKKVKTDSGPGRLFYYP